MPVYEYCCDKCEREVQLTLSIREHGKGPVKSKMRRQSPSCALRYVLLSDFAEILNLHECPARYSGMVAGLNEASV